jgi:hypothetical protein
MDNLQKAIRIGNEVAVFIQRLVTIAVALHFITK